MKKKMKPLEPFRLLKTLMHSGRANCTFWPLHFMALMHSTVELRAQIAVAMETAPPVAKTARSGGAKRTEAGLALA